MLSDFGTRVNNFNQSGYDVIAIATNFPNGIIGHSLGGAPFWGSGTGTITVNYPQTSAAFWAIVQSLNPIAIMSFSRGDPGNGWVLEYGPRNLAQGDWTPSLDYIDNGGTQTFFFGVPPVGGTIGGVQQDTAPPNAGKPAIAPDYPPDATGSTATLRASNLPRDAIKHALDFAVPPINVTASKNLQPMTDDPDNRFVSSYMAYHVAWYRDYSTFPGSSWGGPICKAAGHTHVGIDLFNDIPTAKRAVLIQLKQLIIWLDKPKSVP